MLLRLKILFGAKHKYTKGDVVQCVNKWHDPDRYMIMDVHKAFYIVEQHVWDKVVGDFVVMPGSSSPIHRYNMERDYVKVDAKKKSKMDSWNEFLDQLTEL
jgi:nitrous oxide reductase accessory protein NosL